MRRARLRQLTASELPRDREVGFAICRDRAGGFVPGPLAEGHVQGVSIPLVCPADTVLEGTWHTHPTAGGGLLEPSPQDLAMQRKHGLKRLCITVPETGQTRCW